MRKKIFISIIIVLILFIASIFVPVRKGTEWINDDEISDIGHYEEYYYNIYGGRLNLNN